MENEIVHASGPVLLVGGGECTDSVLKRAAAQASRIVAADGGAVPLLAAGVIPDAVIGDMDSLDAAMAARIPAGRIHRIGEQNSTDFDKCLRNIRAPLVLAHGFLGGRVDHQLAAMTVLCARADRRCVLIGREDVIVLAPPDLALDLPIGSRLSLYPMGAVSGRSEGLRWPIDGIAMRPDGRTGTSNEVTGAVRLQMDAPRMLLILPVAQLAALMAGLAAAPGGWPARA
ncbi:thiamine diphosphokinase [Tropicibacter oceani]|uniref:Thiamine diphosphokinase n=1 Tax=Tropicibacter oceani TaxID=3058420 RepID=A0ABY8QHA2_9RHOB|nr:thiamine diphosphokinase [Tropicibacter oceani]WGW03376.1 thiamine diphosphokinase [Tropicibacter oceani]